MNDYSKITLLLAFSIAATCHGEENQSIRASWQMPPRCSPFAQPRIQDLKEELHRAGYRLVISIHPKSPDESKGETLSRDLYIINADGTGLEQFTNTPDKDERAPRTSPNGKFFTYNQGKYLVDVRTRKTKQINGDYVWTPDSNSTIQCGGDGIVYTDIHNGQRSVPIPVKQNVWLADMTSDGKWLIFEIRNYLGSKYTIDLGVVSILRKI